MTKNDFWRNSVVLSNYLVPGLDVCPPVQEDFDSLEVTLPSSNIESGGPTLSDTDSPDTWDLLYTMPL